MIEELSNINREWLQLLSRKSLEDLAWQEKEIIEKLKAELAQALDSNDELKDNAESNYGGFVLTGASAPDPVAATNDNRLSDSLICGRAF